MYFTILINKFTLTYVTFCTVLRIWIRSDPYNFPDLALDLPLRERIRIRPINEIYGFFYLTYWNPLQIRPLTIQKYESSINTDVLPLRYK
jgi:hypothetical protein